MGYFTTEQLEEIKQYILATGTKDTDLPSVSNVSSNDEIVIVQNGYNKKINLRTLFSSFGGITKDLETVEKYTTEAVTNFNNIKTTMITNENLAEKIIGKFSINDNGKWVVNDVVIGQATGDKGDDGLTYTPIYNIDLNKLEWSTSTTQPDSFDFSKIYVKVGKPIEVIDNINIKDYKSVKPVSDITITCNQNDINFSEIKYITTDPEITEAIQGGYITIESDVLIYYKSEDEYIGGYSTYLIESDGTYKLYKSAEGDSCTMGGNIILEKVNNIICQ